MTFLQVKYFLTVVDSNSISKAADALFVSRTAVSRTLRELEEEFGIPLLERTLSGVQLTEAGKVVYKRFMEIQHKNVALESHIEELRGQLNQKTDRAVKLCITPVTVLSLFPEIYRRVKARFPDIEIITSEADRLQATSMLEDGTLDFRLTYDLTADDDWDAQGSLVFFQSAYVLCMAPDNPLSRKESVSLEDLVREPIIFFDQHPAYRSGLELMFEKQGIKPNIAMRTYQLAAVREAVRHGLGCAPMPQGGLDDGESIVAVPLLPRRTWNTALIWNPKIPHNSAFRDFLDEVRRWKEERFGEVSAQ